VSAPPPKPRSVNIAEVLRDARLGDLRWLAEERAPYGDLESATQSLFDLLADRKVDFVLVGGMAMLQYVEGRNTRDIDLIMALADLARLPELVVESRDADFARASYGGVQIDLLLTSNALFETVRRNYVSRREFSGRQLPVATPEGLVLLKLFALPSLYRHGDFARSNLYEADITALLRDYRPALEPLLTVLQPHLLATDIVSLREVLSDARHRIARIESQASPPDPAN
jgi:hypothetical protein